MLRSRPALLRRQGARLRITAVRLGGLLIKLGQFLSTRVDLLPEEFTAELRSLQDEVPAEPFSRIRPLVERELGQPLEAVFSRFDPEPVAAASLGQVHLARLADGREVAVKVQRPEVEAVVETDLIAIRRGLALLNRFTGWGRTFHLDAVYRDFVRTVREELDYLHEGRSAERFAANFARNRHVRVPVVYWPWTTRRVLTMERSQGIKVTDFAALEAAGIDRHQLAALIVRLYLRQILRHGFVHLDPHPGNLFVNPPLELTFLDFGMTLELDPKLREGVERLFVAIAKRDIPRIVEILVETGFLLPGADLAKVRRAVGWAADLLYGKALEDIRQLDFSLINEQVVRLLREQPFQIPANISFLGRAISMVVGLTTQMDPSLNLVEIFRPFVQRVLTQRQPVYRLLMGQARELGQDLLTLPALSHRVLGRLERGDLEVGVDFADITRSLGRIEALLQALLGSIWSLALAGAGLLLWRSGRPVPALLLGLAAAWGTLVAWRRSRRRG